MGFEIIKSIAKQTKFLAINAVIEVSRSGDKCRGFAIMVDQVRSLASKTQSTCDEIQQMVFWLQFGSPIAVETKAKSEERGRDGS